MKQLILVRHGESEWNKMNLFTGWTDVDLTETGRKEAYEAGKLLKAEGYRPQFCFTSYLKRAVRTLNQVLEAMDGYADTQGLIHYGYSASSIQFHQE